MRLIILLIVLLIGGLLVARQLRTPSAAGSGGPVASTQKVPEVPTTPQGLPAFKKSINKLVNQTNRAQQQRIQSETQ